MRFVRLFLIVGIISLGTHCLNGCTHYGKQDDNGGFMYVGYYLRTDKNDFFIAEGDSIMFSDKEIIKIFPVDENWDSNAEKVSFDGLSNGDKIGIDIETVGDLKPRVTQVYRVGILKTGDIKNIDESVISAITELGFRLE